MTSSSNKTKSKQTKCTEVIQDSTTENSVFDLRTKYGKYTFAVILVIIAVLIQFLPNDYSNNVVEKANVCNVCPMTNDEMIKPKHPSYAIYGKSSSEDHLIHVHNVLQRLNYSRVELDDEWNLLWAHDYPFRVLVDKIRNLQEFQKVNHIPGSGFLTNKVDLATTDLSFIPKSFKLPEDKDKFVEYTEKYPNVKFVQKHNQHRNIRIKQPHEIDFNINDTFIQEFVENPYLVDGYKFDIGVYVIITSIEPLRVYLYTGDVLFRFCPVKYYPFDSENIDKYIVGDDYLPIWDVPSLKQYYQELGFSMKDSFDAYVRSQKQNSQLIWDQVEFQVRKIILEKEKYIAQYYRRYKRKENFFELIRFDLIIDAELNVYLMEGNMSPNLSSAHFKPNRLLYEQILYNLFMLVGLGTPIQNSKSISAEAKAMISDYKNIVTFPDLCADNRCLNSCENIQCQLCKQCLSKDIEKTLHSAFQEHIHKANNKRIFPVPIINLENFDIEMEISNLSRLNKIMSLWFYGKCKLDVSWCT